MRIYESIHFALNLFLLCFMYFFRKSKIPTISPLKPHTNTQRPESVKNHTHTHKTPNVCFKKQRLRISTHTQHNNKNTHPPPQIVLNHTANQKCFQKPQHIKKYTINVENNKNKCPPILQITHTHNTFNPHKKEKKPQQTKQFTTKTCFSRSLSEKHLKQMFKQ